MSSIDGPAGRGAPFDMQAAEFRRLGHHLVDRLAEWLERLPRGAVTPGEEPAAVRAALGRGGLPARGAPAAALLDEAADLLFEHSLFNGHPRFFGFITSSAAPIGALADLLAATLNPNVGGWVLSPMATEIELQTVRWIAELLGFPVDCGGLLVSGGNVANLVGFWAGRRVKTPWDLRREGYGGARPRPRVYASRETHTWIEKAVDLSGMGSEAIRWIPTSSGQRLDPDELARAVARDRAAGDLPLLAVGTAGTVSTGAVDPLREIAAVCREHDLWFHVDGAYGGPAAILADADPEYAAIADADSVAVDPHKWLYAPLEAGCALVRDREALRDTFAYHPPYYPAIEGGEEPPVFFHELGPQNSRGFRALKVWLGLRLAGRDGLARTIGEDVELARALHREVARHPELEAGTCSLSITTFRFVPADLRAPAGAGDEAAATYLDRLNEELVQRLMSCGELFVSNAVVDGAFWLRACIVNFRTTAADVGAIPEIVARHGRALDATLRPAAAGGAAGARPAG